jgi:hypothetical protein
MKQPTIKRFIICIGGTDYIDKALKLTTSKDDAFVVVGKKVAKGLVDFLKKRGVSAISLIEVN